AAVNIVSGPITTTGDGAFGIAAAGLAAVHPRLPSYYGGGGPYGPYGSSRISIQNNGPIVASGADAGGIVAVGYTPFPNGPTGPVTVVANANITATGRESVGIAAASGTAPISVTVNPGVSVMGGYSSAPGALSTQASTLLDPDTGNLIS